MRHNIDSALKTPLPVPNSVINDAVDTVANAIDHFFNCSQ